MTSYRFRRRAFLTALSGGVGLKIMLRNLEGSAQGMRSPGRLLVTYWPVGIVAGANDALWSGGVVAGGSQVLRPFADNGLGPDMTVIRGLSTPNGPGGPHEGGMVSLLTGIAPGGTRAGEAEADDGFAVGPSYDQLLLQNVPTLQRPGQGYANSICDSRTDFGEISAKVLSYSTQFQDIAPISGPKREAIPLMPTLSPLGQYNNLFSGFVPGTAGTGGSNGAGSGAGGNGGAGGGASSPAADPMLKRLVGRRSVLDFAVEELNRVKRLAPSAARGKLEIHTDAILSAETALASAINAYPAASGGAGGTTGSGGAGGMGGNADAMCVAMCRTGPPIPPDTTGMADPTSGAGNPYNDSRAKQDDAPIHQTVGQLHLSILKAAFVCDLIRVGTFQWAPSTTHVGFALYPDSTEPYMHHPTSHKIFTTDTVAATTLAAMKTQVIYLFNVHSWYFARHAETFAAWKNSVDGCGNNLLDFTAVPFLTEVRAAGHERTNLPAMIIGGKQLGFVHGLNMTGNFTINRFWGTIAQAYGYTSTDAPFAAPIAGVWAKPAT